ncbi:M23 family protein, putative [Babesia ovata]|uniref:M23 family protein, putative n=1 Tax=Babesia ovata TaxID=189622 RepID=A0A2H6KG17_9APIC|nr:M23 family protein, putative [Babesia ovata]GBE61936.1 M23 family protein, putative [Babesia ovata]
MVVKQALHADVQESIRNLSGCDVRVERIKGFAHIRGKHLVLLDPEREVVLHHHLEERVSERRSYLKHVVEKQQQYEEERLLNRVQAPHVRGDRRTDLPQRVSQPRQKVGAENVEQLAFVRWSEWRIVL